MIMILITTNNHSYTKTLLVLLLLFIIIGRRLIGEGQIEEEDHETAYFYSSSSSILLFSNYLVSDQVFKLEVTFMGDGPQGIKIYSDHFEASTSCSDFIEAITPSTSSHQIIENVSRLHTRFWTRKNLRSAASMLKLFSFKGLTWGSDTDDQEKVVLTAAEVESLRSRLCDLEERESYLKAQLEHVDEILRSARLSGYLYVRTRWAALPGEPPPLDDTEVDDWLPRFLVLHGSCIFFYLMSTDLSPQDSTLLCDITEVGPLPSFTREDGEVRHCFYILTCHGLRFECSSSSKVQVDIWLRTLQVDCKLEPEIADLTKSFPK